MSPRGLDPSPSTRRPPYNMEYDDNHQHHNHHIPEQDSSSLFSQSMLRAPTPMKSSQKLQRDLLKVVPQETNLFDLAEQAERESDAATEESYSFERAFFGADSETLSQVKYRANEASSNRGRNSIRDILNGSEHDLSDAVKNLMLSNTTKVSQGDDKSSSSRSPCGADGPVSMWNSFTESIVEAMGKVEKMADNAVDAAGAINGNDSEDAYSRFNSFDEFDEDGQLRRLGSWNTLGTTNTAPSVVTEITATSGPGQVLYDDDGNQIPEALVDLTRKKKIQKKKKRVVKFEYPPIKSLKECPRHDPKDLPNLFFTEEELNQIEDDRLSTNVADDVEVICVVSSAESFETPEQETLDESIPSKEEEMSTSKLLQQTEGGFSLSRSSSRRPRLFRRTPQPPKSPAAGSVKSPKVITDSTSAEEEESTSNNQAPGTPQTPNKRLISSVHILMRERSMPGKR